MATSSLYSTLLCLVVLVTAGVCLATAKSSPKVIQGAPSSDELYGILSIVGGENTETIVQTVSIDINSGSVNTLVTNFIYAGSSLTYDGISTLDDKKQNIYYATDWASAFIYSANVKSKQLNPPIDVGATAIVDLKMDTDADTLYISLEGPDGSVLLASYSTNGGPATLVANLTDVLLTEGGQIGEATLDTVNDVWYFLTTTQSGALINTLSLDNLNVTSNPIAEACQKAYGFLFTTPTTQEIYAIMLTIRSGKVHYSLGSMDASGSCTETPITNEQEGIFTAFTYSPYSNNLYYAVASDSGSYICYNQVPLTGTPTCTNIGDNVISDLQVAYPK